MSDLADPRRVSAGGPPVPRILVLAPQALEVASRVRNLLRATGAYAVSDQRAEGPVDLVIPILSSEEDPSAVLTDLRRFMPEAQVLPALQEQHLSQGADRLLAEGTDFLVGPIRGPELLTRVRRLLPVTLKDEAAHVRARLHETLGLERLIGVDPAFEAIKQQILRVAKIDVTVLVTGETGTGKELTAQAIHYLGDRAGRPFVPVNCAAVPADLFENELFGHHRGAFTDARSSQRGLIAEADGGTLLLDEINALPPAAQAKLLRFIEDRSYRPLGSPRTVKADVRLVAATNTDLKEQVAKGMFREDLFYRLHVVALRLPPLRERSGDIPLLGEYFLRRYTPTRNGWSFSPEALAALTEHEWPGNVRELENLIRQMVCLHPPKVIRPEDLPWPARPGVAPPADSFRTAKARTIAHFERSYLAGLLHTHRGNITRAARAARQDRRTFRRLIQKHRLDPAMWGAAR